MCQVSFNLYGINSNDGHFFSRTVIIRSWISAARFAHFLFSFISFYLFLFTFQTKLRDTNYKNNWNTLWSMKNDARFEFVPWKNIWFCFVFIARVHFGHKTAKFWFWKSLKYFNFFILIKANVTSDLNMSNGTCLMLPHFHCLGSL